MTPLEELKARDDVCINANDAAKVIGCNPQAIRITAREHPERLGFPLVVLGKRVYIPRVPFINFVESGAEWFQARAEAGR